MFKIGDIFIRKFDYKVRILIDLDIQCDRFIFFELKPIENNYTGLHTRDELDDYFIYIPGTKLSRLLYGAY